MDMNDYAEKVRELVAAIAERHKDSLETAIEEAVSGVKALPEFPELMDRIIRDGIRQLVYAARHVVNVDTRRQAGHYGATAKTSPEGMAATNELYRSAYDYCIGAKSLGSLKRAELEAIAKSEG